jgi:hypothetical protein
MRVGSSSNGTSSGPVGGLHRAKAGIHEIESKMRHKATKVAKRISSTFHHDEGEEVSAPKEREGIVSINGRDVETMRCFHHKRVG